MIEKLDLQRRKSFGTLDWLRNNGEPSGAELIEQKINELIDIVNKHDQKLKLLLDGLEKWAESQQDKETTIVFEQK